MSLTFSEPVFGPIHSRRLGTSLGINVMPAESKICNFNCIYCECGWNPTVVGAVIPSKERILRALETKLQELVAEGVTPNALTFSGNGEPTLHPEFAAVVRGTVALRNKYVPTAKVCVLSNAGMLHKTSVIEGLMLADKRILKLDSAFAATIEAINQPNASYSLERTLTGLKRFKGDFTLQTMFLKGTCYGRAVDNTTEEEVNAWLALVDLLKPAEVMIYTVDRETPVPGLEKCPLERLEAIAARIRERGMEVVVAG